MAKITPQDLEFIKDQARRSWESLNGRLDGATKDISEGDRVALSYVEAVTRLMLKYQMLLPEGTKISGAGYVGGMLEVVLLTSDSRPDHEDYE